MIRETENQKKVNDKIRMEIISKVMEIKNEDYLRSIYRFANALDGDDWKKRPMDIESIAQLLDGKDIKSVLKIVNEFDMSQIAAIQMKEAFEGALQQMYKGTKKNSKV